MIPWHQIRRYICYTATYNPWHRAVVSYSTTATTTSSQGETRIRFHLARKRQKASSTGSKADEAASSPMAESLFRRIECRHQMITLDESFPLSSLQQLFLHPSSDLFKKKDLPKNMLITVPPDLQLQNMIGNQ